MPLYNPPTGGGGGTGGTPDPHHLSHEPGGSDALTSLTEASFDAGHVDGTAGTASLRTLGTGATQAAEGDHTHAEADVTNLTTDLAAKLVKASNLSDLANAGTARTNLGLGTAATHATGDYDASGAAAAAQSASQPLDSDLTAIAALSTTSYGRSLLEAANAGAGRTLLGLAIGSDVQGYDADLAALGGLTSAADKGIQFTGSGTAGTYDLTTAGKALLDDANATAQRTTLGLGTSAVKDAGAAGVAGAVLNADDATTTNARTPSAHKTTHEPGGTDAMSVDAAVGTGSLRTLGLGASQAARGSDLDADVASYKDVGGAFFGAYNMPSAVGQITNACWYYAGVVALAAANSAYCVIHLNASEFGTVTGRTAKIRVKGWVRTNAVSPGINFTFALYPVATWNGASGAQPGVATLGTAVCSTTLNNPGASAFAHSESSDADYPADGAYVATFSTSGANAANSLPIAKCFLQARWA